MYSAISKEFDHAPDANLDYGFIWELETGETITGSTWAYTTGVTLSNYLIVGGTSSVYVAGGVIGHLYQITNTITTTKGGVVARTDSRTLTLSCKKR